MKNATVKDVAFDAEVSTATVSRVLNGNSKVSIRTRQKVESSIKRLHYSVNPVARSLKVRSTKTVAVIAPQLSNDFFVSFFEQLESELYKQGYTLLICSSNNSVEEEAIRIAYLTDRRIDGLIAIPASLQNAEEYRQVIKKKIPLVFVDRMIPNLAADSILVDNSEASYEAVSALIHDGQKRIAFLGGDGMLTAQERYAGYARAMKENKLKIESDFVFFCGMSAKNGYDGMDAFLKKKNRPNAVFFANLMNQIGAAERIMRENRFVQENLYCAGFDTTFYLPLLNWCKYGIAQPVAQIGSRAAALIIERMSAKKNIPARLIRLKTNLIRYEISANK